MCVCVCGGGGGGRVGHLKEWLEGGLQILFDLSR